MRILAVMFMGVPWFVGMVWGDLSSVIPRTKKVIYMQLQLIEGWQKFYKMWSVWAMILIAVLPELYNAALAAGILTDEQAPQTLSYLVKIVAFIGIATRIIKQAKLEAERQAALAVAAEKAKAELQ